MYKFTMYKSLVDCIPLIPLLQFVLDLSYKLFLHYYAAVGKNLTDKLRHAVCQCCRDSCILSSSSHLR